MSLAATQKGWWGYIGHRLGTLGVKKRPRPTSLASGRPVSACGREEKILTCQSPLIGWDVEAGGRGRWR